MLAGHVEIMKVANAGLFDPSNGEVNYTFKSSAIVTDRCLRCAMRVSVFMRSFSRSTVLLVSVVGRSLTPSGRLRGGRASFGASVVVRGSAAGLEELERWGEEAKGRLGMEMASLRTDQVNKDIFSLFNASRESVAVRVDHVMFICQIHKWTRLLAHDSVLNRHHIHPPQYIIMVCPLSHVYPLPLF